MAGPSKSPSKPLLPEHSIHFLLLRANDLGFRAENLVAEPSDGRQGSMRPEGRRRCRTLVAASALAGALRWPLAIYALLRARLNHYFFVVKPHHNDLERSRQDEQISGSGP